MSPAPLPLPLRALPSAAVRCVACATVRRVACAAARWSSPPPADPPVACRLCVMNYFSAAG